jgi:hypothetical protein
MPATPTNTTSSPSIASQLRRRLGVRKNSRHAAATPPVDGQNSFSTSFFAEVAAVVLIVSVEVTAPLVISTEAGDKLQVARAVEAFDVNVQASATVPVNPLEGVTVMVDVFPVVAPGLTEIFPLLVDA